MLEFQPLFEFSRQHCLAICAALVPANMIATVQTLIGAGCLRPRWEIYTMAIAASLYALLMLGHVATWFMVGVVMPPTFILVGLASVCLCLNGMVLGWSKSGQILRQGGIAAQTWLQRRLPLLQGSIQ